MGSVYYIKHECLGGGKIIVSANTRLERCIFMFEGPDNVVEIEEGCNIHGMTLIMRFNGHNRVLIGAYTTVGGSLDIECSEGTSLTIGRDCMFSHHIRIFTTDMHSIMDDNGNRLNLGENVIIGNHVWIGMSTMVLKGSQIPDGSVLGAGSVYAGKNNDNHCIYAGNPARKVKEGIKWTRERL